MDFCLSGNGSEVRSSQTATRLLAVLWFESLLLVWRLHSRTIAGQLVRETSRHGKGSKPASFPADYRAALADSAIILKATPRCAGSEFVLSVREGFAGPPIPMGFRAVDCNPHRLRKSPTLCARR